MQRFLIAHAKDLNDDQLRQLKDRVAKVITDNYKKIEHRDFEVVLARDDFMALAQERGGETSGAIWNDWIAHVTEINYLTRKPNYDAIVAIDANVGMGVGRLCHLALETPRIKVCALMPDGKLHEVIRAESMGYGGNRRWQLTVK